MSMTDPIADMLTRIRNGQTAGLPSVTMPSSHRKEAIAAVLRDEGYIADFQVTDKPGNKRELTVELKYFDGKPVIEPTVYSALITMVVLTTVVTPPLLKWSLSRRDPKKRG